MDLTIDGIPLVNKVAKLIEERVLQERMKRFLGKEFVSFLFCFFVFAEASYAIIGGKAVKDPGKWRSVVNIVDYSIFNGNEFHFLYCSAVIVHPRLVLTAAHCLENKDKNTIRIYIGNGSKDGVVEKSWPIADFEMHPKFSSKGEKWDFAYILLEDPLPIKKEAIFLPFENTRERLEHLGDGTYDITMLGFGDRQAYGVSERLFGLKHIIHSYYDDYVPYDEQMITVGEKNQGPLAGDSGAPVFYHTKMGYRLLTLVQMSGSNEMDYAIGDSMYLDYAIDWIQEASGIRLFEEKVDRKIVRFSFIPKTIKHDPTRCEDCDQRFFKYAFSFKREDTDRKISLLGEEYFVSKVDYQQIQSQGFLDKEQWVEKLIYTEFLDEAIRYIHWRGWYSFPFDGEEIEELQF